MNDTERYGVLFLCTGNSARSIIAESLLRHWGRTRFDAYSAGSDPAGEVRAPALALLESVGLPTEGLNSKSCQVFTAAGAPPIDFVITVCDDAAESCPYVQAEKQNLHHGFDDPSAVTGTDDEKRAAFRRVRDELADWIDATFGPTESEATPSAS